MSEEVNTCSGCVHLLGNRTYKDEWQKWKCGHKNNYIGTHIHIVSGENIREFSEVDIFKVRFDSCKGEWYEKYVPPTHEARTKDVKLTESETTEIIFSDSDINKGREAASRRIAEARERRAKGITGITAKEL